MTFGVVLVVALLGLSTTFLATQLSRQVALMNTVYALDEARDDVFSALAEEPAHDASRPNERVLGALTRLDETLARYDVLDPGKEPTEKALAALEAGREHVANASEAGSRAAQHVQSIEEQVVVIYRETATWKRLLDARQVAAASRARFAEAEQRRLSEALKVLSAATLSAVRMQHEIDAVARYNASNAGLEIPLERVVLSSAELPAACTAQPEGDTNAACKPSTARVHRAIKELLSSPPEEIQQKITQATWALDAYLRAGEQQFKDINQELGAVLGSAGQARDELGRFTDFLGALSRVTRITNQLDDLLEVSSVGLKTGFEVTDRRMLALVGQIRSRATGLAAAANLPDFSVGQIDRAVDETKTEWSLARSALEERADAAGLLDAALIRLDDALTSISNSTRGDAALTVSLISTAAFLATGLLAVVSMGLLWGSHVFIVRPLTKTTGAILALAQGNCIGQVKLGRRSLGLGALEDALDRLRRANIEREALSRQTEDQRAQIERNMEALAKKSEELEYLAGHDALTGLPNRRHADEFLGGLRQYSEDGTENFALLHVDIDRFKEINDTLGHEAGDVVLRHAAMTLCELCEEEDQAFRIGGDEFLIVRRLQRTSKMSTELATQIIAAMNEPVEHKGHSCRIGASIGIAYGSDVNFSGNSALINADIALYDAKTSGRNRYVEFSPRLQEETISRKTLSDRLIIAVENEEFVPFYQPQFFSASLQLRGLETLCRWQHPELGILSPAHFMEQAEASTLLGKMDQILLRKASSDMEWLRAQGHDIPKISFNVTAERLMHPDLAEALVAEIGAGTEIAVELLESMSLDDLSESVRWAIDTLKDRGVTIEIDDFGSCRASIAGLIAVGPDAMKIDGSIVEPITSSPQHLRLVRAIIDIGEALGIDVIAERVETEEHVRILREQGCSILQGYALAKPMNINDLAEFLDSAKSSNSRSA